MLSILSGIILTIRWLHVLICVLILTILHLSFRSQSFHNHLPSSLNNILGGNGEEYLALVMVMKNEPYYLKEWLQHHYYHMNVSHFYIVDLGTKPPLSTIKDIGIPRSAVTFSYDDTTSWVGWWDGVTFQLHNYESHVQAYGHKHTWMGFIDLDEFLDIKTTETLEDILRDAETHDDIGALKLNWKIHSSAGLLERPESVRQAFDICIVPNSDVENLERYTKTLFRTDRFAFPLPSPHQASLQPGNFSAGEDFKECNEPLSERSPPTHNRLLVHHYYLKSKAEYQTKIDRWPGNPLSWELWNTIEGLGHVNCSEMKRYDP